MRTLFITLVILMLIPAIVIGGLACGGIYVLIRTFIFPPQFTSSEQDIQQKKEWLEKDQSLREEFKNLQKSYEWRHPWRAANGWTA